MAFRSPRRGAAIARVFSFLLRHWRARRLNVAALAAAILAATLADVFLPVYAGRLVDALDQADRQAALDAGLGAFAAMAALGAATVALRHLAWSLVVPLTLGMMSDVAQAGFHRVQRFSTDWHASTFAGSTVRKISRGMWALDGLNDTLLLMLLPSLVAMVGAMVVLGLIWPVMGLLIGIGTLVYVATVSLLALRVIAPAAALSNAQDTRIGGLLSDVIGNNAVVKAFGAEAREDARLAQAFGKWRRRTCAPGCA